MYPLVIYFRFYPNLKREEQDAYFTYCEKARTHRKHTRSYLPYMGMKPCKKGSVKTVLPNFFLVNFHWKMRKDLTIQLKLMRPISWPLSIQIIIAQHLRLQRSSVYPIKKLKQLCYVKKLDLLISHQLKEIHLTQRFCNCDSLLKFNEINPFQKRLITGDEKWIVYNKLIGKYLGWNKMNQLSLP